MGVKLHAVTMDVTCNTSYVKQLHVSKQSYLLRHRYLRETSFSALTDMKAKWAYYRSRLTLQVTCIMCLFKSSTKDRQFVQSKATTYMPLTDIGETVEELLLIFLKKRKRCVP